MFCGARNGSPGEEEPSHEDPFDQSLNRVECVGDAEYRLSQDQQPDDLSRQTNSTADLLSTYPHQKPERADQDCARQPKPQVRVDKPVMRGCVDDVAIDQAIPALAGWTTRHKGADGMV